MIQRIAECRYLGQGYELRVDAASGTVDAAWAARLRADFHDIHEREYSRRFEDADVEIPNVRVRGIGLHAAARDARRSSTATKRPTRRCAGEAEAWFRVEGGLEQVATRYYDRAALRRATGSTGPRSSTQYDSTTVVPPGVAAHVDRFGNILDRGRGVGRGPALAGTRR